MKIKKCKFIKLDGKECNAWAVKNSNFCFTHNPKMKKSKREAVIKGGKSSKNKYPSLPPVKIDNVKDVASLLAQTINEIRGKEIELKTANAIGYLSGHLIKALEISDLEKRILKIEQTIFNKS